MPVADRSSDAITGDHLLAFDAGAYADRALEITGVHALGLPAWLARTHVRWDRGVTTACVSGRDVPTMALNPDFIARHAATPEKLAFVLMHELSHIVLGHLALFEPPSEILNIATDALINAMLCHGIRKAKLDPTPFEAFLTDFYPADRAPAFLLRPPAPDGPRVEGPLARIHRRLYHARSWELVTVREIVVALRAAKLTPEQLAGAALVGSHGQTDAERDAAACGQSLAQLPDVAVLFEPMGLPKGVGDHLREQLLLVRREETRHELVAGLRAAILRTLVPDFRAAAARVRYESRECVTPFRGHDRRAAGRERLAAAFGAPRPLLFRDVVQHRVPQRHRAALYLDVSGSMGRLLPLLHSALLPLHRVLGVTIHAFSTVVETVTRADFDAGRLPSTGGTSVQPVLEHLVQTDPPVPRALVVTDGYIDRPTPAVRKALARRNTAVHVVVAGDGPDLSGEAWVASCVRLPVPAPWREPR